MLAKLLERHRVTDRDTVYVFECPELARKARPGQFVELKLTDSAEPFLRRPISIFDADGERTFTLLVRTVGRGTEYMTRWIPGTEVDVLGPLGNGFSWDKSAQSCILVGGGIGLAPLNYLARELVREGRRVRLLFSPTRDADVLDSLPERERLEVFCSENRAAVCPTLSGMAEEPTDAIFCCGPEGMLEAVGTFAMERGISCQLSVERRMGCGFGICVGCAIAIRTEHGVVYKKVCKDGPVFRAEEVSFREEP